MQGDDFETDINADQAIRLTRESVRRDLEILLNTRPCYLAVPSDPDELKSSLILYLGNCMNLTRPRLSLVPTGYFPQFVEITDTARLLKMSCGTNILRDHHARFMQFPGYGLPHLLTEQMATEEQQERFRRSLEAILRHFESRSRELGAEVVAQTQATPDRTLRFRIYTTLEIAAATEVVVYDTFVDPVTGGISFSSGGSVG